MTPMTNPNIEVIAQDMSDEAMCQLYHRAHVMIFPTRGEGFGFPPREFAATGGLALATAWGGTADDIHHWGVPITDYAMEPAYKSTKNWAGHVGEWAVPNVNALAQQLRNVVDAYDLLNTQDTARAQFATQTYTWAKFAQGIGDTYDHLLLRADPVSH